MVAGTLRQRQVETYDMGVLGQHALMRRDIFKMQKVLFVCLGALSLHNPAKPLNKRVSEDSKTDLRQIYANCVKKCGR